MASVFGLQGAPSVVRCEDGAECFFQKHRRKESSARLLLDSFSTSSKCLGGKKDMLGSGSIPGIEVHGNRHSLQTRALFGGLFGGKKEDKEISICYHDVALPFPKELLNNTFLAGRELKCCYIGSKDGFSAMDFHLRCDFKGPCVIVCEAETGLRFGAFSPEGYRSTDDYYDSLDAFLFYWPQNEGDSSSEAALPRVVRKIGGDGAALFDFARGGPQFGADGLLVGAPMAPVMGGFSGPDTNSGVGDLREARSRLGLSYALREDGKDSLFGDQRRVRVKDVTVFCCPKIASLY